MKIEQFPVSRDPEWYHAWPDVVLASDGTLICVFSECTHHHDRSHTRIMLCSSSDRGRTWSPKRPLTEATDGFPWYYNCARIFHLPGAQLGVIVDRIPAAGEGGCREQESVNVLFRSSDNGKTWGEAEILPLRGIVPDKIRVLPSGRWLASAHYRYQGALSQFLRYSDDNGKTWSDEVLVAHDPRYQLCEVSLVPVGGGTVAALMRENSRLGLDCFKSVSHDNGETWGLLTQIPLPGCHRPVAGFLQDGRVFITYRFFHGGGPLSCKQNFFCAVTDRESLLSEQRNQANTRIIPIDYDPAFRPDTGYSGWVQFDDGEIYIVNYIVDDAVEQGQIRGYSLRPEDLVRSL